MKYDSPTENLTPASSVEELAESFVERFRRGEQPSISEYAQRYPHLARQIEEIFPALMAIEQVQGDLEGVSPDLAPTAKPPALTTLGDFRIIREVGRGGMGVVYEAEQVSLGRRVALKVLSTALLSNPQHRKRFQRESRAAARLHHTNIVPVFGVGEQDGVSYYVMQFIHGLGLDDVLRELVQQRSGLNDTRPEGRSGTAPRSQHFVLPGQSGATSTSATKKAYWSSIARIGVQVAEALHYAHQQGVVHRDIKPANLLLDTGGAAWVTDFGLAKASDSQDLTHTGDVLGTLRYMAPEQFSGQTDARSDIYALGLTLYEMLALRPAFDQKDRQQLMKELTSGTPPRLGSLEPGIPRDLETILHKTIERDPAHRYQTAGDLANDLQRYLGDEPIRARRVSLPARLRRWFRRNPAIAGLTTTIALLLVAAAVVSSIAAVRFEEIALRNADLVVQANDDKAAAVAAKQSAEAAQGEAEAATERERELRAIAERERDRASVNFTRARLAVNKYLDDVTETELLSVPGMQPLREKLLAAALTFYAEFTQERSDDPELLLGLADAQYRLGRIYAELGKSEASSTANTEAIRLFEQLRAQQPDNLDVQVGLAHAYYFGRRYQDTEKLCQTILEVEPQHAVIRGRLAETYNALAIDDKNDKDIAAALAYHRQAFELREALAREFPDNAAYLAQLGVTLNNLGVLLSQQRQHSESLRMFERGVAYSARACDLQPQSIQWGEWLCIGVRNVAYTRKEAGATGAARQSFARLVAIRRDLALRNPAVARLQAEVYRACIEQSRYEQQLGHTAEANRAMREARRILELIPHDTASQLAELARMYAALSQPAVGEPDETAFDLDERAEFAKQAVATLTQAIDAGYRDLAALQKDNLLDPLRERDDFRSLLVTLELTRQSEGLAATGTGSLEQQLTDRGKAVKVLKELIDQEPGDLRNRKTLAATLHAMGMIQSGLKQFEAAEQSLNEALAVRDQIRADFADDPHTAVEVIATRVAIGQLYWENARFPDGHRTWQECSEELRRLAESNRDNQRLQQRIAAEERIICDGYGRFGLWPLAGEYVRRRVEFGSVSGGLQDAEFSALLLLHQSSDVSDKYLRMLAESVARGDDLDKPRLTNLLQTAAMARSSPFAVDDLVSRAREAQASQKGSPWSALVLATSLYRAGELKEAQKVIEPIDKIASHLFARPQSWYVKAIIASAMGDNARAREHLNHGESLYRQVCLESLDHPVVDSLGLPHERWHHLIHIQVQRRKAIQLIFGGDPPKDPWQHLILARGYRLIGETEQADQELAAAAATDDAQIWLARARLLDQWGVPDRSAVDDALRRMVEIAPNDPLPWIQRGRLHAEQGDHEQADADFARAASLTPNELNKFLEAGWWVVGPYPEDLDEFGPPEIDPDPSRPVHVIDPQTGLSNEPSPWVSVSTGANGSVDLPAISVRVGSGSVYMLAIVYSPDECSELLRVLDAKGIRMWCNGEPVARFDTDLGPNVRSLRIPIVLHAGMNRILLRTKSGSRPTVNLGDSTSAQVYGLAEQGFYQRTAAAAIENLRGARTMPDLSTEDLAPMLWLALLAGDDQFLSPHWDGLARLATDSTDFWSQHRAAMSLVLTDDPMVRKRADEIVTALRVHIPHFEQSFSMRTYGQRILPLYAALQGDTDGANNYLEQWWAGGASAELAPQRALLALERGQPELAAAELDIGLAFWEQNKRFNWYLRVWHLALLRRTERQMTGTTERTDAVVTRIAAEATALAESRDPQTSAFDQLVDTYHVLSTENKPAYPYVMRGRRLAELGRVDQAEIDFNKAVELAPGDVEVLLARARFHVQQGDRDSAVADFAAAARFQPAGEPLSEVSRETQRELADKLATEERWNAAAQVFGRLAEAPDAFENILRVHAYCALMADGEEAFRARCHQLIARFSTSSSAPHLRSVAWTCALIPDVFDDMSPVVALARRAQSNQSNPTFSTKTLADALLRAGEFEESEELLEGLLADDQDRVRGESLFLLAMAHEAAGHHDEARERLAEGDTWFQQAQMQPEGMPWPWRLSVRLLHEEAHRRLEESVR